MNNSCAKKNSRIIHSTQYLNQFNSSGKHSNALFVSSGGGGGGNSRKSKFTASIKQNPDKRKKQQMVSSPFLQQQQQNAAKNESVKLWFFKGFATVSNLFS